MTPWKKTFVSAFVAQVFSIVGFSFVLPFLPYFVGELGDFTKLEQARWAGYVMSGAGLTLAVFALPWGMLADRYGRKAMVVRAMVGGTIVLNLMASVETVQQLIVCRLLQGALTGTVAASVALVASVVPSRRSGFALGMMQSAVMIGMALGPFLGGIAADHFGYRTTFRLGSLIVLCGSMVTYFGIKEDFSPPARDEHAVRLGFRELVTTGGFLGGVFVLFSSRFSHTVAMPSFPLIVEELLGTRENLNSVTGSMVGCSAVGAAVSAAVLGFCADSWGPRRILVACCLGGAVTALVHAVVQTVPQMYVLRVLHALAIAGMMPAGNAIIRRFTDRENVGKAFGVATALSTGGLALGPWVGGEMASEWGLRTPFVVQSAALVGVAVLAMVLLPGRRRAQADA